MKSHGENENTPFFIRKITCTDTEWKQWIQQQFGGVQAKSQQHPSAAEKWEHKEQSLWDTTYLHHSVLHGRAWLSGYFWQNFSTLKNWRKLTEE